MCLYQTCKENFFCEILELFGKFEVMMFLDSEVCVCIDSSRKGKLVEMKLVYP